MFISRLFLERGVPTLGRNFTQGISVVCSQPEKTKPRLAPIIGFPTL
jgi:hypothetical protein